MQPQLPPLAQPSDVAIALGVADSDGEGDPTLLPQTMQVRMDRTLAKVSRRFRREAQRFFTPGVYTTRLRIEAGAVRLQEIPNKVVRLKVHGLRRLDYEAWQEGGEDWTLWQEGGDPGDFQDIEEGGGIGGPVEDFNAPGQGRVIYETPGGVDNMHWPPPVENHPAPRWTVESNWIRWHDVEFWQLNGRPVDVTYSWDTPVPDAVIASVADIVARNLTIDPMSATRQSKTLQTRHYRQDVAEWVISGECGFTKGDIEEAQSYRYQAPPIIIQQYKSIDMEPSVAFLSDSSW